MVTASDNGAFDVGDWRVEPSLNRICCTSETTFLRPQVMELLVYLAEREGRVVSADELLDNLWPGKIVTDSTLYNCVAELRHALSGGDPARQYVETVTKKGYRLRAPVTGLGESGPGHLTPSSIAPLQYRQNAPFVIGGIVLLGIAAFLFQARSTDSGSRSAIVEDGQIRALQLPLQLPHYADSSKTYGWAYPALSPDGRQIAYIGTEGAEVFLYLKNAADNRARRIAHTEGAASPTFSPDGKWIAFFAQGRLMRIATDGGRPVEIADIDGVPLGASWGDDDMIIFSVGYRSHLQKVHSSGRRVEALTALVDGDLTHRFPHVLPGAHAVLYQSGSDPSVMQAGSAGVWLFDNRSGASRFLVHGNEPKYAGGRLAFLRPESMGYSLWSVPFDPVALSITGTETPHPTPPIQAYDISRSGALVHATPRVVTGFRLSVVDRDGQQELFRSKEAINRPRFSPDGELLVAAIGNLRRSEVWQFDPASRAGPTKLTSSSAAYPVWSATGDSIAFAVFNSGIFTQELIHSARPSLLIPHETTAFPIQWTDEGLLFAEINAGTNGDLYYEPREGDRIEVDADEAVSITAAISPDGTLLAYSRQEWNRPEIFVREFPDGEHTWKITEYGGDNPKWSADGSTIYFESVDRLNSIRVVSRDPLAFGNIRHEFSFSGNSDITFEPYDVFGDGDKFAVVEREYGESPVFTYVNDWQ